jgi:transposase
MAARRVLNDAQWRRIEALLPGKPGDAGRHGTDNRLFVEAVLWVDRTGLPWRDLPEEFGHWNTVYRRFSRWSATGVWQRVLDDLACDSDLRHAFLDTTIVRAHQHSAGALKKGAPKRWGAREAG